MAVVGEEDLKSTVDAMFEKGIQAFGPYSSEILKKEELRAFDGIIIAGNENADASEQKILDELHDSYITMMAGTEMAIVSAQPKDIYEALALVADITRNRVEYDLPLSNPLPKLYVEKKEDGDKARYIKKKGFDPAAHKRENVTYTTAPKAAEPAKESSSLTETTEQK
jgi:4-hydroxythreonine-4-phosphate dehydrogenase